MSRLWIAAALVCSLLVAAPAVDAKTSTKGGTPAVKTTEDPAAVQAKLDAFASDYLNGCNTNVTACRTKPTVTPRGGKMVATFIEIDPKSLKTEMYPSPSKHFLYMAKLMYVEHTYEAEGNTSDEALHGDFKRVKSRKLTELPHYAQGKWQN